MTCAVLRRRSATICIIATMFFASHVLADSPNAQASRDELVAAAKARLVYNFKDPSSARWRNLYLMGDVLCGEVNAKNSYGGYTGFRRFYSAPPNPHPLSDVPDTYYMAVDGDGATHDVFVLGAMGKCDPASGEKRVDIPDGQ